MNSLILKVSSRGKCDKSDSLKAFESVVAETLVEDLAVVEVVEAVGNQMEL